jgi:hypothetical protein
MRKALPFFVALIILFLLLACNLPAIKQTGTVEKDTATQEEELEPTETIEPSATLAVTATPTPIPEPTSLNAAGPYLLYSGESGIWISNPDGSFLTQITSHSNDLFDLRRAVSPRGDELAMIIEQEDGQFLVTISIPDGEVKTIAQLSKLTMLDAEGKAGETAGNAAIMISYYPNVAWQPGEGRYLAFVGAVNGPTSDVYTYDTQTGEIAQLTSGPSHAIIPIWSPDGQYIYHFGVNLVPPIGGALIGYNKMEGAWAVRISDGEVITQPTPKSSHHVFVGWKDDNHYIMYDNDETCISKNLRSVDVTTGKAVPLMNYSFYFGAALSPENGSILFAGSEGCPDSVGEGVFLLMPGETEPEKLLDTKAYEVSWLPESKVFQAYPEALFSADGKTTYESPVYDASYHPAISKNGYQAWEVIENRIGRIEVRVPGGDWKKIADGFFVDGLIWDPVDGDTLIIATEDGAIYKAQYPDFAMKKMGSINGHVSEVIWLE